jgi:hypothetical protein
LSISLTRFVSKQKIAQLNKTLYDLVAKGIFVKLPVAERHVFIFVAFNETFFINLTHRCLWSMSSLRRWLFFEGVVFVFCFGTASSAIEFTVATDTTIS